MDLEGSCDDAERRQEERHDATTDYYEPHEVIDFGRENEPDDPPRYPPVLAGAHIESRLVELQNALMEAKRAT